MASANARSRMLPSETIVPARSQHTSATEDVPVTRRPPPPGRSPARWLVQFAGGGLGPQVDLGPVGLHLAPDGEAAETQQGEDKQFLHDETFRLNESGAVTQRSRSAA